MEYYFNKVIHSSFGEVLDKVTQALKAEGFGVITEIDMQSKLKEKLGVSFKKYMILGACNPEYAYKAIQLEEKAGTMLPCNVVIIDREDGTTEVAAINPIASMMAIPNPDLVPIAEQITERLKKMVRSL